MKKVLALILIFGATFAEASLVVTVSCVTCTQTCGYSKCYQIKGPNYLKQYCGSQECFINSYNVTFQKCDYSATGEQCSTGVCLQYQSKGCASSVFGTSQCTSQTSWLQLTCAACSSSSTSSCAKCLYYQSSYGNYETCIGSSCNGVQYINFTLYRCPSDVDTNGNSCWCCYQMNGQSTNSSGTCTSSIPMFSSQEFNAYVRSAAELRLYISLLLACALWLML